MSHFVAQSIKVKPNGKIYCTGDDNNVFPRYNSTILFNGTLLDLFEDLLNGNVQPVYSADNYKWTYAMLVSKGGTIEERFEAFKKAITEKFDGKYIICAGGDKYIYVFRGKSKRKYLIEKKDATKFSYRKAFVFANNHKLTIEKINNYD